MSGKDSILELVKSSYFNKPIYKEAYCGVPENYKDITTLGELLENNYKYRSTKLQLRENLISKLRNNENPFIGIIGFDQTVIPAVKRAILAGHDILFIGHIGQGKTKLAEILSENLLSPIPIVDGTITNDIPTEMPYSHLINLLQDKNILRSIPEFFVSKDCEEIIKNNKLDTKIKWVDGKSRYRYVLATPDITVKDLVGQIDVVKVIKKGIEVFDIDSYSPGYLLQARYGILCLDELPVLDPRKQVTMLSILQEGRFTTGALPVFFKPDVKIIATANPIDYTHSGKIIEPLADRLKSHIETHYPKTLDDEILILIQEIDMLSRNNTFLPIFILKIIAKIFQSLRNNPEINSERGVSVRSTIHSMEIVLGEVEVSRSIINNIFTVPRYSDIYCILQSSKFELDEIDDTSENKSKILNNTIIEIIKEISRDYFTKIITAEDLLMIKNEFKGKTFTVLQNPYPVSNITETLETSKVIKSNLKNLNSKNCKMLYSEQLKQFPHLKKIIKTSMDTIMEEQNEYIKKAHKNNISKNLEYLDSIKQTSLAESNKQEEIISTVMELLLEYLRFSIPPVLDRKENKFEYTEI